MGLALPQATGSQIQPKSRSNVDVLLLGAAQPFVDIKIDIVTRCLTIVPTLIHSCDKPAAREGSIALQPHRSIGNRQNAAQ